MAETVVKTAIEMELKVTGADYAVRETQKLSAAQQKHAKDAAKAMDAFERDATAALKKVEKSVEAQERAWKKAQKAMAEGGGIFDKVEDGIRKFNGTIGVFAMGLGALPKAIEVATTAVGYLGKAWNAVGDALARPQLRMQWEKSAQDDFLAFAKKAAEAQQKWADATYATYFGADVDSDKNMARRLRSRERVKAEKAAKDDIAYDAAMGYFAGQQKAFDQKGEDLKLFQSNIATPTAPKRGKGGRSAVDDQKFDAFARGLMEDLRRYAENAPGVDPLVAAYLGADYQGNSGIDPSRHDFSGALSDSRGDAGSIAGLGDLSNLGGGGEKWKGPTLLESMFGTPDDIEIYNNLMAGLMDSVMAGYAAVVSGTESFGTAVKRAIGQTIMAEGMHMMVLAVQEAGMAIASLAWHDPVGAARHGLAAAKFGAGAVLAGVAASALGGGGGSSAGAGAASAGGSGGSGGGYRPTTEAAPQTNIYVIGDSYGEETARSRSLRFERQRRMAQSYESPPRDMEYA